MTNLLFAGGVFVVVAAAAMLLREHASAPPSYFPVEQIETTPDKATPIAAVAAAADRTPAPMTAAAVAGSIAAPAWLGPVKVAEALLSPAELRTTLAYVEPLMEHAANELRVSKFDAHSADDLAAEAAVLQRLELWRAVDKKLRGGDYFVATDMPEFVRPPAGVRFESFPSWQNGRSVTLGFIFERTTSRDLFDAASYAEEVDLFRRQEAARKFNSQGEDERRRLLAEYKQQLRSGSWQQAPAEMQRRFPIGNVVDEANLWMRVPQSR